MEKGIGETEDEVDGQKGKSGTRKQTLIKGFCSGNPRKKLLHSCGC